MENRSIFGQQTVQGKLKKSSPRVGARQKRTITSLGVPNEERGGVNQSRSVVLSSKGLRSTENQRVTFRGDQSSPEGGCHYYFCKRILLIHIWSCKGWSPERREGLGEGIPPQILEGIKVILRGENIQRLDKKGGFLLFRSKKKDFEECTSSRGKEGGERTQKGNLIRESLHPKQKALSQ